MRAHPVLQERFLLAGLLLAVPLAWLAGRLLPWPAGLAVVVLLGGGSALLARARQRVAAARLEGEVAATAAQLVAAQLQLLSLHDVLRGLTAAGGRIEVVDALLRHCRQRCDAREARCYLVEGARAVRERRLVPDGERGLLTEALRERPATGGLAAVLADGTPLLIADPARHPLLPDEPAAPAGDGYLVVPLPAVGGAIAGAVVVSGPLGVGRLDEGARAWLAALGRAAGAVLDNAALYARLNAEHALRDGILNSLGAGLIAFGPDGAPLFHNRAAREMLDPDGTGLAGLTPQRLCPDLARPDGALARVMAGTRAQAWVETSLQRPQQPPLAVRLTVARLPDLAAGGAGLLCVFDDLTALRAMQDQIRQLDKLAAIGRFTSSLAHEIRNPLAGISAGIDYLRRNGGLGEEHREYVRIISQEIERLDRIIRNLFTVARPGYLMLGRCSLGPALDRVRAGLAPTAAQKQVAIDLAAAGDWPEVECDEDQVQQVLLNLLKNAVEAEAPGGTVQVAAGAGARDDAAPGGDPGFVLTVENGGSQLSADDLERVFEPFYSRKPEGTGLGLFVSYNIVRQHGGTLAAERLAGGRTRFRLFLPRTQPRPTEVA